MPDFMGHVHPEWTKQFWELLALRNIPKPIWSNTCSFSIAPCGAGMVVRKEVASHYIKLLVTDPARLNLDRKGNSLISGGDTDMAFCACDLGMGIGMFPELKMEHIIPPERMTVEYLEKLSFSIWYSGKILESFRGKFRPEQKMSFYSKLRRLGRYVLGKHSDPVFRCGLAAERGRQAADQFLNNQSRNVSLNSSHHTT
jgi:hypothetical protein